MRDEVLKRLTAKGVTVERAEWDAGRRYVDRLLETGSRGAPSVTPRPSAAMSPRTVQLQKALELLRRGRTTAELIALSTTAPSPRHPSRLT
jgi:hypothetical protein